MKEVDHQKRNLISTIRPIGILRMSWLNYILTVVSIIAILYSYSVGSTTGVIIWAVVLGLNVALVLVDMTKKREKL